jgi:hypothetical protein
MQAITTLGSAQGQVIVVLVSAIVLFLRRAWVKALGPIAACAGAGQLDSGLKLWTQALDSSSGLIATVRR